jgi:hypothetical protein
LADLVSLIAGSNCVGGALLISDLPSRIFAVVRLVESRVNNFFSQDLFSSSLWTGSEVFVSFIEIAINCQHAFFGRLVIAIVETRQVAAGGWAPRDDRSARRPADGKPSETELPTLSDRLNSITFLGF